MTEPDEIALAPESVLPIQFARAQFGARVVPEMRLQLAVLADAVATHMRYTAATRTRGRRLFSEADEWFTSDVDDGPFSFVAICDSLGLEPAYLRTALRTQHTHEGIPMKRTLSFRHEGGSRSHVIEPRVKRVA